MTDLSINLTLTNHNSTNSMLGKIVIWIRAIRAPFFTASIIPLLLGIAIAWYESKIFNPVLGFLTILAGIAIHTGTNLANDYFDQSTDNFNEHFSPFNGGSRLIQNEVLSPRQIMVSSLFFYLIGIILTFLIIFFTNGLLLLFLLTIAVTLGFFYTALPVKLSYHGLGETAVFVGFGPLGVISGYYIQLGHINSNVPFLASIPIAILIAMVLFLNEFQDCEADAKARKKTLVVALGKNISVKIYIIGILLAYITLIIIIICNLLPLFLILPILTFPVAIKAILITSHNYDENTKLQPANALTIITHLSFGIFMVIAFILA